MSAPAPLSTHGIDRRAGVHWHWVDYIGVIRLCGPQLTLPECVDRDPHRSENIGWRQFGRVHGKPRGRHRYAG